MNKTCKVNRWKLVFTLPGTFDSHIHSRYLVKIIIMVLTFPANQKVLLFVNHILTVVFPHLKIRYELDCIGRTGFLTIPTKYAPREVYPEKARVPSVVRA